MSENTNEFENPFYVEVKDRLDSVGKGMCLAKWTQVTLQLQSGHNHSCHHPQTHKISEQDLLSQIENEENLQTERPNPSKKLELSHISENIEED